MMKGCSVVCGKYQTQWRHLREAESRMDLELRHHLHLQWLKKEASCCRCAAYTRGPHKGHVWCHAKSNPVLVLFVTELKLQLFQYASTNKHVFIREKSTLSFHHIALRNSVCFMACFCCTKTRRCLVNWHRVIVPQSIFDNNVCLANWVTLKSCRIPWTYQTILRCTISSA